MRGDIPSQSDVANELNLAAKIAMVETKSADVSGIGAEAQSHRVIAVANSRLRPGGNKQGILLSVAQPASRAFESGFERKVSACFPAPWPGVSDRYLSLEKLIGVCIHRKATPKAG